MAIGAAHGGEETAMLIVTSDARRRLARKLALKKAASDQALRFVRRPGGWRLRLDGADSADTTICHDGRIVLLLDPTAAQLMKNKTLDVRKTVGGTRLTLVDSPPQKGV
jgi:Fe-S cluster assembly iron-binding protein IscA